MWCVVIYCLFSSSKKKCFFKLWIHTMCFEMFFSFSWYIRVLWAVVLCPLSDSSVGFWRVPLSESWVKRQNKLSKIKILLFQNWSKNGYSSSEKSFSIIFQWFWTKISIWIKNFPNFPFNRQKTHICEILIVGWPSVSPPPPQKKKIIIMIIINNNLKKVKRR